MALPVNNITKLAAISLAQIAYTDESTADAQQKQDVIKSLEALPAEANGPYKLIWGPTTNTGIMCFVAKGADGSYAVAFRGSLSNDGDAVGLVSNWVDNALGFSLVNWKYPMSASAMVSWGMNDALALAVAATDPDTGLMLIDFLRETLLSAPAPIMTTGHSLGGALSHLAAFMFVDQLPRACGPKGVQVVPFSFAAPTVTDDEFAKIYPSHCPVSYRCVNNLDIVPKVWNNLQGIIDSFPAPGQYLINFSWAVRGLVDVARIYIESHHTTINYTEIPGLLELFDGPSPQKGTSFTTEAENQHNTTTYLTYITNLK